MNGTTYIPGIGGGGYGLGGPFQQQQASLLPQAPQMSAVAGTPPMGRGVPQGMGGLLGQPINAMPRSPWRMGMSFNQMAGNLSRNKTPKNQMEILMAYLMNSPYARYL